MRSTKPKKKAVFKVFLYETLSDGGAGKVIGDCIVENFIDFEPEDFLINRDNVLEKSTLTTMELLNYAKNKTIYGWVIKEPCIYRTPLNLLDFGLKRPPQSWCYLSKSKLKKLF